MVAQALSTALAAAIALLLAWKVGPVLGHWSVRHRLVRFLVGLATELRMLPVLVALVPLFEVRFGLPPFLVVGLLGGASRTAAVARFTAHAEGPERIGSTWVTRRFGTRLFERGRPDGAAYAVLLLTVPEIALLEGLSTFFGQGLGDGLGARLAQGKLTALLPLLALALVATILLDRPAWRPTRARASAKPLQ